MLKYIPVFLAVCCLCSALYSADYNIQASEDLKKYVPDVEAALGQALEDVLANQKQIITILKPYVKVSKDVAALLGCPEKEQDIQKRALSYYNDAVVINQTLSNVTLISEADARKDKYLQKGYVNYMFPENGDKAEILMAAQPYYDQELLKTVCLPVIIKADGTIMQKDDLVASIAGACGVGPTVPSLLFMSFVSDCMKSVTRTMPYFSRWYTEGMPYKITSVLLGQYAPKQKPVFDKIFALTDESKELRDKVNLWDFCDIKIAASDKSYTSKLDAANIQYSCMLMDELYEKIGKKGLTAMNAEFKYDTRLTNEKMAKTVKTLFDIDFRARLLEYTPADVKALVEKGSVEDKKKAAGDAVVAHDWEKARAEYSDCLMFDQTDYNSRLNLATVYRELGDNTASDLHILIAATTMGEGKANIRLADIENNDNACVVLGKYFYLQEAYPQAYGVLFPIYEEHQDWEDVGQLVKLLSAVYEKKDKE